MSNDEAEKAAREWQESRADEWFDDTTPADAAEQSFLAGVEWERKRSAKLLLDATNDFGKKEGGE